MLFSKSDTSVAIFSNEAETLRNCQKKFKNAHHSLKDLRLVFLLCQLVIDILKLDCLLYNNQALRQIPSGNILSKGMSLLCRLRYAIIFRAFFTICLTAIWSALLNPSGIVNFLLS